MRLPSSLCCRVRLDVFALLGGVGEVARDELGLGLVLVDGADLDLVQFHLEARAHFGKLDVLPANPREHVGTPRRCGPDWGYRGA